MIFLRSSFFPFPEDVRMPANIFSLEVIFNLIRTLDDKSTKTGSEKLMKLFNDFIEKFDLRDLHRGGGKFTWTNKQTNPIQSNIDRVLISTEWEEKYPMATLSAMTRIGSDHTPLLLDDEEQRIQRQR